MKLFKAGPLTIGYENGFLRRIAYGESEVLRMIYFALRDHNWNTLNSQVENEVIVVNADDFEITYDCFHLDGGVTVMEWRGRIRGNSDGSIIFEIRGAARETFKKNRAGFCVLHPLDNAGRDCTIVHEDGSRTTGPFPRNVAAENPFKSIVSMSWERAGVPFALEFEGDVFETEDQRNWGDASFKTFCTPLAKPFPVELRRGEKVFQRITFKPLAKLKPIAGKPLSVTLLDIDVKSVLPLMGVAESTESAHLPEAAISRLQALKFKHYRIDVYPSGEDWVARFSSAYENGYALGCPLEVALHLTKNFREELEAFSVVCQQSKVRLRKVLLLRAGGLVSGQDSINEIPGLKEALPNVLFGAGTNYNFNEINNNRFHGENADFISFAVDPQEHAFDDLTILENIGAVEHLVKSAKAIYGEQKPVHISPLTLRKRFNPYATNPADLFIEESRKADPRQKEVFAALWTFGSICNFTLGGASAITFFQTIGKQGILSQTGEPYPVYEILKEFAPFQGKPVRALQSSDPLSVQGIILDEKILALVNLTQERKTVQWQDIEITLKPQEMKFHALDRA